MMPNSPSSTVARSARPDHARYLPCSSVTEPATVRQILEHVGEPTSAPAIGPARSPPLEMEFAQRLAAPEAVFEAFPVLEFDQTANRRAVAGHDRLLHDAGVDAEPIPELEFDQTLGW